MLKSVCMCEPFLKVDNPIVINRPKVEKYGSPSYANRLETQTHAEMAYTNENCKKQLSPPHSELCYDQVNLTLQCKKFQFKFYYYR